MADSKYGHYILKNAVHNPVLKTRPHLPSVISREEYWPGISGMNCNFGVNCVTEPYLLPDPPHKHEFDEYLFFIGGNCLNMQEFDAEIEIALGEEWEVHIINSTSVVYIPKGLQHCPIHVKKVGKPFLFGHIMLSAAYSSSQGGELYSHDKPNPRKKAA